MRPVIGTFFLERATRFAIPSYCLAASIVTSCYYLPYVAVGGFWNFIVSVSDHCHLHYFTRTEQNFIIGIKHCFSCINVCQVPREVLKTSAWKTMFDRCYCINSTIMLKK